MRAEYPVRFEDASGTESTTIVNDGCTLSMTLRGVVFESQDFESWEPRGEPDPGRMASFQREGGELHSYVLDTAIPVPVASPQGIVEGRPHIRLGLGPPDLRRLGRGGCFDLRLEVEGLVVASSSPWTWFEDVLLDLQKKLPDGWHLRTCITCAYSDYSPYGHGAFGGMACFRGEKEAYLAVDGKRALFALWDRMTEWVQETHHCPEYARRRPGAGYRG